MLMQPIFRPVFLFAMPFKVIPRLYGDALGGARQPLPAAPEAKRRDRVIPSALGESTTALFFQALN
jgi:hypothetical protein